MIAMNSGPRNFLVFRWQDVATAIKPNLRLNESLVPVKPVASAGSQR
jgi:hypothetical protein